MRRGKRGGGAREKEVDFLSLSTTPLSLSPLSLSLSFSFLSFCNGGGLSLESSEKRGQRKGRKERGARHRRLLLSLSLPSPFLLSFRRSTQDLARAHFFHSFSFFFLFTPVKNIKPSRSYHRRCESSTRPRGPRPRRRRPTRPRPLRSPSRAPPGPRAPRRTRPPPCPLPRTSGRRRAWRT